MAHTISTPVAARAHCLLFDREVSDKIYAAYLKPGNPVAGPLLQRLTVA